MSHFMIDRIKEVIKIWNSLESKVNKCRPTFRNLFTSYFTDNTRSNPHFRDMSIFHGSTGRQLTLHLFAELKWNGATKQELIFLCMLIFLDDYDTYISAYQIGKIDPNATATTETIMAHPILSHLYDPTDARNPEPVKAVVKGALSGFKTPSLLDIAEDMQRSTPMIYNKSKMFWVWNFDHYEQVDETDILISIMEVVDDERKFLGSAKHAILDAIKIKARQRIVKEKPKTWVQLGNGIVYVCTGEHIVPTPDYMLTNPIPHLLSNSTETPTFDKLFNEWVDADKVQLLYEICAYCLVDDYPIHRLFMLIGSGRNGKGQFRDVLVKLVGTKNTTSTTLEGLAVNRFESARLWKKKLATVGETDFQTLRDTKLLKMVTGGDPIPAEFKNKTPFEFYNTAKVIVNTNSPTPTNDKTDGFYSRFVQIKFPNQYQKGKDIINTISDDEYDNLVTKCMDILRDLLDRGEFTNEGCIDDKRRSYEALSNPMVKFIEEECTRDVNAIVPLWHFEDAFNQYLSSTGQRRRTSREIRDELTINGLQTKKNHRFNEFTDRNGQWTGLVGICLKNNPHIVNSPTSPTLVDEKKRDEGKGVLDMLDYSHSIPYNKKISRDTPTSPTSPTKEYYHATPDQALKIRELKQFIGGRSDQRDNREKNRYNEIAYDFCKAHPLVYKNPAEIAELVKVLAERDEI